MDVGNWLACASLAVAGWAAWTSHRAREWQRERDRERQATRVTVTVEHAVERARITDYRIESLGGPAPPPMPDVFEYVLTVVVRNDGEASEFVRALYLQQPGGDHEQPEGVDLTLPGEGDHELPPRGRVTSRIRIRAIPFDVGGGFVAIAHLASDEWVRSEVEHLIDDLRDDVERLNERDA